MSFRQPPPPSILRTHPSVPFPSGTTIACGSRGGWNRGQARPAQEEEEGEEEDGAGKDRVPLLLPLLLLQSFPPCRSITGRRRGGGEDEGKHPDDALHSVLARKSSFSRQTAHTDKYRRSFCV